jgi:hypothetical protein
MRTSDRATKPSRQACQHATQPVQHSLLLSRTGVTLRACLANTDTDVTATLPNDAALCGQPSTIATSHDILRCQDRHSRVDSRKDEAEVCSGRARCAARRREVDVEVDVGRQVRLRTSSEQGRGKLGSKLGIDGAVC